MNTLQGEKYLWQLAENNNELNLKLAASCNLSLPIVQTLVSRGMDTKEQLDDFLFSSFQKDVSHPSLMKDAQKSIERICKAIENQENILIFGDYDVDGITSSALMLLCLLPLGARVNFFLPVRKRDGYGISTKIVERSAKNNYTLIITVDNGITAFEPALKAKELEIDLIITDHHCPHDELPDAFAIVNPNRKDCDYPYKNLAGVGVTFKLLSLLYEQKGLPLPDKVYELLLLGTIADVVPLNGENRFWVRHGLHHINNCRSYPIEVLKRNINFAKPSITSTDIGFFITPQINALGRLQDPRQGVKFLIGPDKKEVEQIGKVLFELNRTRREIERSIFEDVEQEIKNKTIDLEKENVIIAASTSWPAGVIGLVASRLVSEYARPVLLFHITDKGIAKGSCRSIPEFNIFEALQKSSDIIEKFGGHAFAAGLSLTKDNLPKLKENLEKLVARQLTEFDLKPKIIVDANAFLSEFNKKFIEDINLLEPFGNKNAKPAFYIKNVVQVKKPSLLKDAHVKCSIFADGVIKPLIFFKRPELFQKLLDLGNEQFDIAAHVSQNYWNGRMNIELIGLDIAIR